MANNKRSGGMGGRESFFKPTGVEPLAEAAPTAPVESAPAPAETPAVAPQKRPKSNKVHLTVTVYPKTLSVMELLKVELRKSGSRVTISDVLDEAIWALVEKKKLTIDGAVSAEQS